MTESNDQIMMRNGSITSSVEGTLHRPGMWGSHGCLGRFLAQWGLYLRWCRENVCDQQTLIGLALSDHLHEHQQYSWVTFSWQNTAELWGWLKGTSHTGTDDIILVLSVKRSYLKCTYANVYELRDKRD